MSEGFASVAAEQMASACQVRADLHDAFEELLDTVYRAESDWRLMDRIDLATRSK